MNFQELIRARHSVRDYQPTPVPEEALVRVLEAAQLAPSAANYQPWHFFVVRDEALRQRLFNHERQTWISAAPVVIVACSYPQKAWVRSMDGKSHADVDSAIAMDHLVLAATEEGLGSCWICAFNPQVVREALQLPAELEPVAITPLGYPATTPGATPRKPLDEIITWR